MYDTSGIGRYVIIYASCAKCSSEDYSGYSEYAKFAIIPFLMLLVSFRFLNHKFLLKVRVAMGL